LLPAGVVSVDGSWAPGDAIEVVGPDGAVFAKGIARLASSSAESWMGRRNGEVDGRLDELIHRDDLVVLAGS
jgi:glutamate 5-kinase